MAAEPRFSLQHRTLPPRTGEPPYPGLLLLHGRGANELDLLDLGPELDPRLFVISAQAPHALGPGSYYWYDLEASIAGRPTKESIEASLDLVVGLMGEAVERLEIDPTRFFACGFSMGGAMTAALLLTRPETVAAALILSGYVPVQTDLSWKPDAAAGKPVFQGHGVLDEVLPIQFGRMSRDFLRDMGLDLTYREYPIAHAVSPEELGDAGLWMAERLG